MRYNFISSQPTWAKRSTANSDCSLHQISPYIGRVKVAKARELINEFSKPYETIVDPFCGSGVIPIEAVNLSRSVVCGDVSPYAYLLTKAKLYAPSSVEEALNEFEKAWTRSQENYYKQDLRKVPKWVRAFFHSKTLKNILRLRDACIDMNNDFTLACLLGILHHERPGFLSYPSSHLVPYLRNKKYPKVNFPELYKERTIKDRMVKKIIRTYKRPLKHQANKCNVYNEDARKLIVNNEFQTIITSPPYMNRLDYIRDNRLRLWILCKRLPYELELPKNNPEKQYIELMDIVLSNLSPRISSNGFIVLILGDVHSKNKIYDLSDLLVELFKNNKILNQFSLVKIYEDNIPDIRRSRKDCRGTKKERVLIYQKSDQ